MLMKFKPVVNFTNILQAAFALIFICQKNTNPSHKFKKTTQRDFHTKKFFIKW